MTKLYLFFLLIINLSWTIVLYLTGTQTTWWNYSYNISYGLNFLLAGLVLLPLFKTFRTASKILTLFVTAFFSAFIAQVLWFTHNVILQESLPYPSIADAFWLLFYPLIAIGFVLLLKQKNKALTVVNALEMTVLSAIIFTIISTFLSSNQTTLSLLSPEGFFNTLYILLDSLLIALSIIVLRNHKQNKNMSMLYITFGLLVLSIADTLFTYQTALGVYWNGNSSDLLYAISAFLLALATTEFEETLKNREVHRVKDSFLQ